MNRAGVSKVVAGVAVVVLVVIAGGVAFLYLPSLSNPTTSSPGTSNSSTSTSSAHTSTSSMQSTTSTTSSQGTTSTTSTTQSPVVTVIIPSGVGSNQNLNFQPATLKVVIGVNNTIKWVQMDPIPHDVASTSKPSGAQSFKSPTLNQGMTYTVTLTVAGTYKYLCEFHPNWMLAEITVVQA